MKALRHAIPVTGKYRKPQLFVMTLCYSRRSFRQVEWERAYNEGRSTQVPVNSVVRVKARFARQLAYRGNTLALER